MPEAAGVATACAGDATDPTAWPLTLPPKVTVGFALEALPEAWRTVLPEGAVVVAPVREATGDAQRLVRAVLRGGAWETEWFDRVLYVPTRHVVAGGGLVREESPTVPRKTDTRRLPIV